MASRSIRRGLAALLTLLCLPGCTDDGMTDGCEPPPGEDALLAAYRADPVFAVRPPEAVVNGTMVTSKGCRETGPARPLDGDPDGFDFGHSGSAGSTDTEAELRFLLNVGFTQDELDTLYDVDLRARGWVPKQLELVPDANMKGVAGLHYCREVNGAPTFLTIIEHYTGTANRRAGGGVIETPSPGPWPRAGDMHLRMYVLRGFDCTLR